MKKILLDGTDLAVNPVCLGSMGFGDTINEEEAFSILDRYKDAGGIFIDTANVYGRWNPGKDNISEKIIGKWLSETGEGKNMVVATKGGHYDLDDPFKSRINEHDIRSDLEESLSTLGLDHIDLYWLHRDNEEVNVGMIVDVMESLVKEGKIRYYGASNYRTSRMIEATVYSEEHSCRGFSAVSNQWSLAYENSENSLSRDPTMAGMDAVYYEWSSKVKIPFLPYTSTAHGFFQKLYSAGVSVEDFFDVSADVMTEEMRNAYINDRNQEKYGRLTELSEKYSASIQAISIAALKNAPFQVIPIVGARTQEQLNELIAAADLNIEESLIDPAPTF